jgi:hypothetical protein
MAVEAASKIADLNAALPLFDDPIVEGDDHIRLLKSVMKLDAFSKAETAPQTIVSPLTLDGLVTGKVGFKVESALPYFELREDDTALPGGLFRMQSSAGEFALRANTAPAGDFSTGVNIIKYSGGILNFEAPVAFDLLKIEGTGPALSFVESDQAAPAGRFRLAVQGGVFVLQKALTGEFTTVENLLSYDPPTGFTFHKTVAGPMRVGNLLLAGLPTGAGNAGYLSMVTGSVFSLRSGVASNALGYSFQGSDGVTVASFSGAGSGVPDSHTVITQEKGDARYVNLGGVANAAPVRVGDIYIAGVHNGAANNFTISAITGNNLILRGGIDTTAMIQFVNATGNEVGRIDPVGTAAPLDAQTLITREKGDARYLLLDHPASPVIDAVAGGIISFAFGGVEAARIVGAGTVMGSDPQAVVTAEKGDVRYLRDSINNVSSTGFGTGVNNAYVGAAPDGTTASRTFSVVAGAAMDLRSGLSAGTLHVLRDSPHNIITLEKGNAKYAPISARRFKESIAPTTFDALDIVSQLHPQAWVWGGELDETQERRGMVGIGLIAEDVEPVLPAAVTYQWVFDGNGDATDEKRIQGLDALALIGVLIEALQEMTARIEALEAA